MTKPRPRNHKDQLSKAILKLLGEALARYFTGRPDARALDAVTVEQQIVPMTPDLILKVTHPDTGDFHLLLEVQSNPDPSLPERLALLTTHLRMKHGLPVVPVVVYLFSGRGKRPSPIAEHFLGLDYKVDFHEIVLPEFEALELLTRGLDGPWWPFSLFARGGLEAGNVLRLLDAREARPDLAEILPAVLNLVTRVVDSDQVRALLEDPMFDSLLRKVPPQPGSYAWELQEKMKAEALAEGIALGEARGEARGEVRGENTGKKREALLLVKRLIARKFGLPDADLTARLEALPLEALENLAEAMLDLGSPAELEAWLDAQS